MSKLYLAIAAAMLAVSALGSAAEARGSGQFYSSYFFRMQGRQQQKDYAKEQRARYEREKAYAKARARELAAAKAAAAERARTLALKQKAAKANDAVAETPAPKTDAALKKADLVTSTLAATASSTDTEPSATQGCRKFSAATGGLVETPCK